MKFTPDSVYAYAMGLSADDRAVLVDRLLESLHEPIDPEIEAAWAAEAERRLAAYDRGEMRSMPGEELFRSS